MESPVSSGTMLAVSAALIDGPREPVLVERPRPSPSGDEVLLGALEVGLCGTDREILEGHYGTSGPNRPDLVLGHECLAQVLEAPAASSLRAGDLVVPMVRLPCAAPECRPCRTGHQDFCITGSFVERGIRGADGFLAERLVEREEQLVPVPSALRSVGVLVEPLTVAEKGLARLETVRAGVPGTDADRPASALVIGAGPVGLLAAALLSLRGWTVTVASRSDAASPKAQLARELGATYRSTAEADLRELGRASGGFPLIFEAAGDAATTLGAIEALSLNGVLVATGLPGPGATASGLGDALGALVLGNRTLIGSVNASRRDFERAVEDLGAMNDRWPCALERLITRLPLIRAPEAFAAAGMLKPVLTLEGGSPSRSSSA